MTQSLKTTSRIKPENNYVPCKMASCKGQHLYTINTWTVWWTQNH